MPGAPGTHVLLTGTGNTTFVASGRARYDLSQLASLQGPPPRKSYLRSIMINCDLVAKHSSSGTLEWRRAHGILKRVVLQMQGHTWVDFAFTGGQAIRQLNLMVFGKLPQLNANQSLTTTDLTIPLKFFIPCFEPRSTVGTAEEDMIPVGLLTGSTLEIDWGVAAEFGSAVTINTTTTKLRAVSAEIVQRDEVRWPAPWTWQERNQAALSDYIAPEGVLYTDVAIEAIDATGLTTVVFAIADYSSITYTDNGLKIHDALDARDIVADFNDQQITNSTAFLTHEAATADLIPIQWLPRSSGKKTHHIPSVNKPYLQVTGTAPATPRMILKYIRPTGPRTIADFASKANQNLPAGYAANPRKFVQPKSASKQPMSPAKGAFVAQKLVAM